MLYVIIKILITALLVAGISELMHRYTLLAALLAALPLTSALAFIWNYWEQKDPQKIIDLSYSIFWLVIPSLVFFLVLPVLLKHGMAFAWAMLIAAGATAASYASAIYLYKTLT
jgi:peptidoglycan/LPS O-acetylase OafA/YrhL